MNDFVRQCRREWQRLRVPDPVADEMAADLTADLADAQADGVSREALLGLGADDPRSFAAAWATERGVIRPPLRDRMVTSGVGLAAITACLAIAVSGVVVATFGSSSQSALPEPSVLGDGPGAGARPAPVVPSPASEPHSLAFVVRDPAGELARVTVTPDAVSVSSVDDDGIPGIDARRLGWVLLAVGLGGAVLAVLGRLVARRQLDSRTAGSTV